MSEVPEGYYDGTITAATVDAEGDGDDLVLVWSARLGTGDIVDCRHRTTGDYAHVTREVAEHLGLEWPYGISNIESTVGKDVRVRVKHKTGKSGGKFVNAYIITGKARSNTATSNQMRLKLDELAQRDGVPLKPLDDNEIPF